MEHNTNIIFNKLKGELIAEQHNTKDYIRAIYTKLREYEISDIPLTAKLLEHFLIEDINNIQENLKISDFETAKYQSMEMFSKFQSVYGFNHNDVSEITELLGHIEQLSTDEKNVFLSVLKRQNGVSDFIVDKIKNIKDLSFLTRDELNTEIETCIFSDDLDKVLRKKYALNEENAGFYLFFNYVRKEILPNINHETVVKFYLYALSGKLHDDLKDENFSKMFIEKNTDQISEALQKKIKIHQIPMMLENRDKSDDYSNKIKLKSFPLSYMNRGEKSTPQGYIDYAISDILNESKIYVAHIKASTMENDIYKHDERSLVVDRALKNWAKLNGKELVTFDSQKGHKMEIIKKNYIDINADKNNIDFPELKKILDTLINKLVYEYTKYDKTIIQPGDIKYSIETLNKKTAYENFILLCENITKNVLDINNTNGGTLKIFSRSMDWINHNLLNDPEFLSNKNSILELRKAIIDVSEKFNKSQLISDKIHGVLDRTKSKNLEDLYQEVSLSIYTKEVLSKNGYFNMLSPDDFINVNENFKIEKFKDKIYQTMLPIIHEFMRLEKTNRSNGRKLENIHLKYKEYHDGYYTPNSITRKIDGESKTIYFSNPTEFQPKTSFEKDFVKVLDMTILREDSLNPVKVKELLNSVINGLESGSYFDEFDSKKRYYDVRRVVNAVKNVSLDSFVNSLKNVVDELDNEITPIIVSAKNRYEKDVPREITRLTSLLNKISEFKKQSSYNESIDMVEFEKLKTELNRQNKTAIKLKV